jgi:N6-adenosine-specific RNA methylase IME4
MSEVNTNLKSKQMDSLILSDQDLQALASLHAAPSAIKRGKPVRVKLSNGDHVLVTFDEGINAAASRGKTSIIPGKVREVSAKPNRFGVTKRHRDEMDDLEALRQSMKYVFGDNGTPKPAS